MQDASATSADSKAKQEEEDRKLALKLQQQLNVDTSRYAICNWQTKSSEGPELKASIVMLFTESLTFVAYS
jgi:hypothetical protein